MAPWTIPARFSAHGIFQSRILEWGAIFYFKVKYVCYKNDEGNQSAVAVLEYHENFVDYFYVIEIDLYQEDLNYSFKELLNQMIIYKR